MSASSPRLPFRERYRLVVSVLLIPLGIIVIARSAVFGLQAWTLIILGLAMMGLGIVRLRTFFQSRKKQV
jgi:hypothetical protein